MLAGKKEHLLTFFVTINLLYSNWISLCAPTVSRIFCFFSSLKVNVFRNVCQIFPPWSVIKYLEISYSHNSFHFVTNKSLKWKSWALQITINSISFFNILNCEPASCLTMRNLILFNQWKFIWCAWEIRYSCLRTHIYIRLGCFGAWCYIVFICLHFLNINESDMYSLAISSGVKRSKINTVITVHSGGSLVCVYDFALTLPPDFDLFRENMLCTWQLSIKHTHGDSKKKLVKKN